MSLRTETIDGVEVIHVDHAQLSDTFTIHSLGQQILEHVGNNNPERVLLNMENVEFISSTMVGKLISLNNNLRQKDVELRICCVNEGIREVLQMVRFDLVIPIYDTQEAGIQSFQDESKPAPPKQDGTNAKELEARANSGDADAQYELGVRYEEGNGVLPNSQLAIEWLKKAEAQGHVNASYKLATAFAFGVDTEQDFERAMPHYERAAMAGHVDAQYMMGLALHHGLAGMTNYDDARAWYLRASDQGHKEAASKLQELDALTG